MGSIDPLQNLLHIELFKRSLKNNFYRNKSFNFEVDFDFRKDDFGMPDQSKFNNLEMRAQVAINDLFDIIEERELDGGLEIIGEISFKYRISVSSIEQTSMVYGRSNSGSDKYNLFLIYGRVYERLLHQAYLTFLNFKKYPRETLSGCRLMFAPDWASRSLFHFMYSSEFQRDCRKMVNALGLNNFMKIDILY